MKISILLLLYFFCISITLPAQKYTALDSLRGSYHGNRSCYDLNHYHLRLTIDPVTRFISGSNRLTSMGLTESRTMQVDLDPAFDIDKIETSLGSAKWNRSGSSVTVTLTSKIKPGIVFWVEVFYHGHPHIAANPPWDGGFVWASDKEGFPWVGVSCEGQGASLWFPSKDHPADEPDSAFLQYEVPKNLVAVGNGQFLGKKSVSDSTSQFSFKVSYPVNHYNITFNAGAYQTWTDTITLAESGSVMKMDFFALREDLEKAKMQWKQSHKVLKVLGELFGDYPFQRDGYKLVQTPYRGMEHQSCIAYGEKFVDNAFGFDYIIMHETGHEWWGNKISANDHADLWIHESFTTYAEALFVEKLQGFEKSLAYLLEHKKKIKNKSNIQGERDLYFNDWKDSDMYYKGCWMLHSLRYIVNNDTLWFASLKAIAKESGFKPISGDQLIERLGKQLKINLVPFFAQFLNSTTWPVLEYKSEISEGKTILSYQWNCSRKDFEYPAPIQVNGNALRLEATSEWKNQEFSEPINSIEAVEKKFLYKIHNIKKK